MSATLSARSAQPACQRQRRCFAPGFHPEFAENAVHVPVDRSAADVERLRDLAVGAMRRQQAKHVAFTPGQIFRYRLAHPNALVVHRINECDERKGERFINDRLARANAVADATRSGRSRARTRF